MILGVGTDIVEIARIERSIERHGERFTKRIYTDPEIAYCTRFKRSAQHFAGRWAAKEAAGKALGTGVFGSIRFRDVEVTNDERGKPLLAFSGSAAELASAMGAARLHVSIAHSDSHATAVVVIEGEPPR
ncbi:MAG: holo-ACP synthase [Planctomycetota bacterium]